MASSLKIYFVNEFSKTDLVTLNQYTHLDEFCHHYFKIIMFTRYWTIENLFHSSNYLAYCLCHNEQGHIQ